MQSRLVTFLIHFMLLTTLWGQTTVPLSLPQLEATRGDTIEVVVTTGDLIDKNVYDFNGKIKFRDTALEFIDATHDGCLPEVAQWDLPTINTTQPGMAIFAGYGAHALTGTGALIKLFFHVTGNYGDSTALEFISFEFTRESHLKPQFTNGSVMIRLKPIRVNVTTNKGERAQVIVDGTTYTVPFSTSWYPGTEHTIGIEAEQSGGEGILYRFERWSDGGGRTHKVQPTSDLTYTAYLIAEYYLKINAERGNPKGEGWYQENTSVPISVDSVININTKKRFKFNSWLGSGFTAYSGPNNPVTIVMTGPITETVIWDSQYRLEVKSLPENIAHISGAGWYNAFEKVTTGTAPSLIQGRNFKGWQVDGKAAPGNPITITMDTSHVAVADYSLDITVTISTSKGEGVVLVDGLLQQAPVQLTWSAGAEHTIGVPETQAEQDGRRFYFISWSDGGERIHPVTPQHNMTFTANLGTQYQLTVKTEPAELGEIEGSGWYSENQMVTTGTAPATKSCQGKVYSFVSWLLEGESLLTNPINVLMDRPKTVIARYYQNFFITGRIKMAAIPLPRIKVRLVGTQSDSVYTDEEGYYVFHGLKPDKYIVQPVAVDFSFVPASRSYPILFMNKILQDFEGQDITAPKLKLLAPNGGERFQAGRVDTIKWHVNDNVAIDSLKLFISPDNGNSWAPLPVMDQRLCATPWVVPGFNSTACRLKVVAVDLAGNRAEDMSDGSFEIFGGTGSVLPAPNVSTAFFLSQNFPNPFNPFTEFTYQIPHKTELSIMIYNLNGQRVKVLFDGIQAGGCYCIGWNGLNENHEPMPSGIYYYQLRTGHYLETRKMILMR